jgi:hypothetical protein
MRRLTLKKMAMSASLTKFRATTKIFERALAEPPTLPSLDEFVSTLSPAGSDRKPEMSAYIYFFFASFSKNLLLKLGAVTGSEPCHVHRD